MNRFPATRRKRLFQASPAPALVCGSFEEKHPIVIKDEPRMNTNSHECRWTHSNEKRHQNASATLLPWYDFVSFVDNPSMSMVTPPNQQLINPSIGVHSCPFVVRRFPWWMTLIGPSWMPLFSFVSDKGSPCSSESPTMARIQRLSVRLPLPWIRCRVMVAPTVEKSSRGT